MNPKPVRGEQSPDERQTQKYLLILNLTRMEQALEGLSQNDSKARDLLGSVRTIKDIVERDVEKHLDQVGHLIEIIRRQIESLNIKIVD